MLRTRLLAMTPVITLAVLLGMAAAAEQASDPQSTPPAMHENHHGADAIVDQVANARTAADHNAIAQRFDAEALRYDQEVAVHQKLARTYRMGGATKGARGDTMAKHCDRLVKQYTEAAKTQREMAAMHREMAKEASR